MEQGLVDSRPHGGTPRLQSNTRAVFAPSAWSPLQHRVEHDEVRMRRRARQATLQYGNWYIGLANACHAALLAICILYATTTWPFRNELSILFRGSDRMHASKLNEREHALATLGCALEGPRPQHQAGSEHTTS